MRQFSEFCACPFCAAEHKLNEPSKMHTRMHRGQDGVVVARRTCANCTKTWDESIRDTQVFDGGTISIGGAGAAKILNDALAMIPQDSFDPEAFPNPFKDLP